MFEFIYQVITNAIDVSLRKRQQMVGDREAWHAAVHGFEKSHDLVTEQRMFHFIKLKIE